MYVFMSTVAAFRSMTHRERGANEFQRHIRHSSSGRMEADENGRHATGIPACLGCNILSPVHTVPEGFIAG